MNYVKVPDFPVVIYNLSEFEPFLEPLCDILLKDGGQSFLLGPDGEKDKQDIWEVDDPNVRMIEAVFDSMVLEYLDEIHPQFKGKGRNYDLEKDAWLNGPRSWQGTRIHRHWQPFLLPTDIGDVVTVFYPQIPSDLPEGQGDLLLYEQAEKNHLDHVWLPENTTSTFRYTPKQYDLIMITTDTWHKAKPFTGNRFSLATDVKTSKV